MIGSDVAREYPEVAARVVLRAYQEDGDVQNAWDVLVAGVGSVMVARHHLETVIGNDGPGVLRKIMRVLGWDEQGAFIPRICRVCEAFHAQHTQEGN